MPVTPTYPGVYVEEIPSGVHTITGVATSIGAFIDFFREGPVDRAVRIQSMADFNRIYGGMDKRSEASYAISQFFLNGGSQAYVVRTARKDGSPQLVAATVSAEKGATEIVKFSAISEGIWGNNLRVDINHNTDEPTKKFNLTVTRYASSDKTALPVKSEQYLNLTMDKDDTRYAVDVINEESKLITTERKSLVTSNDVPAATGLTSSEITNFDQAALNSLAGKKIKISIGASGDKTVTLRAWAAGTVTSMSQLRKELQTAIRTADTSAAFAEATVELVATAPTKSTIRIISGRKAPSYDPVEFVTVKNFSAGDVTANTLKLSATESAVKNVQEYQLGHTADVEMLKAGVKGADGELPEANDIIGQRAAEPYTGMYALEHADIFNIMCIPRAAELSSNSNIQAVYDKALAYCAERRSFLIIDIPGKVNEVEEMETWLDDFAGLRSKNSAVYFPRLKMPDPLNEYRLKSVAASGTMAGLYSRTDSTRGVWKAAAGTAAVLRGVSALDTELTDAQNGTLNPLAANCFRNFPIYGNVSWGARTLDGSDQAGSEWKYISVRRLSLFLEESLFRGTKWVVFESNDEPLWAKVRMNLGSFMMSLFRRGAFQGTKPDEAFYVKCDSETTTQDDRNKGIINIEIGFAPLKPAEFVVLKFQQIAGKD